MKLLKYVKFTIIKQILNKFTKMSATSTCNNYFKPPECVRGMIDLDRSQFDKKVLIPGIIADNVKISEFKPILKKYILKLYNFKPVQVTNNSTVILLNPTTVQKWLDINNNDRELLEKLSLTSNNFVKNEYLITYNNFTAYEILQAILPENEEGVSSYTITGHVVHVNLRDHLLPFKKIIGEVLLDKVPGCKTVVNKLDMIDNAYRNFKMEILCGEDNLIVEVKENKLLFKFDYATVYWNSRLSTEHERIVKILQPGDVLFDVFAGVGPFAIPASKKKCFVYANDLNPESFKWLNHNSKINKVSATFLKTYNKDGRDFILNEMKSEMLQYLNTHNIHITMNLPALAVEFLNSFINLYSNCDIQTINKPPIVYVYCFTKGEGNCVDMAKNLLYKHIGYEIEDKIIDIFKVRTVSNFKEMMRISFKLDEDILLGRICNSYKRKFDGTDSDTNKKLQVNL